MALKLLLVEDNPADADLVLHELRRAQVAVEAVRVESRADFEVQLGLGPELILSDYQLPGWNGLDALRIVRGRGLDLPFIIVSGAIGEELAVEAMKQGADDYIMKDRMGRLGASLSHALERKRLRDQMKSAQSAIEGLAAIVESSDDAIFGMDLAGVVTSWNRGAEVLFGYSAPEIIGRPVALLIPPERMAEERQVLAQIARGAAVKGFETVRMGKDRSRLDISVTLSPIRDSAGRVVGASKVARSIAERKLQEQRIARLMRIQAVLSGINSAIVRIRDRQELFNEACRIAVDAGQFPYVWLGLLERETMHVKPLAWKSSVGAALIPPESRLAVAKGTPGAAGVVGVAVHSGKPCISNDVESDARIMIHEEHRKRGIRSLTILPLRVSRETVGVLALHAAESGFFDQEEMALLVELSGDIGFALDHIGKAEKLDYLAYFDELTGLANRRLLHDRLGRLVRDAQLENRKAALLLLDIERFKLINDTLGREAGDRLLQAFTERLVRYTRDPNRLARIGADVFGFAIPDLTTVDVIARRLEEKFAEWFSEPYRVADTDLRISAKVGIAIFPDDGVSVDALFANAEAALKRAKATGERYLFYTEQMTERVAEKFMLENKLRQALEKGQFILHYQPKADLAGGTVCGAEALIRWNDPETGLVPPGHFIPLLEETGLILEVGRWALRQAAKDHLRWAFAGFAPVRIAVNVSPLQLRHRDFVADVAAVLAIDPRAAAGLELEITESVIMEDVGRNIASLEAIRAMGVTIAIDDFGTGYSSLNYLSKLPVDTLKIDRYFVNDMTTGPQGLSLVQTIINLAHSLGLKVVAEGVETEEQRRLLRLLNCEQMQGFLFSKPMAAEEFEAAFLAPGGGI